MHLHDLLRQRLPLLVAEHARALGDAAPLRAPPPAAPSSARGAGARPSVAVTWPFQSDRATRELPLRQVDVRPLQRHDLAAPQPGFAAEQHDQMRRRRRRPSPPRRAARSPRSRGTRRPTSALASSWIVQGTRSMTSHSTAVFSSTFRTVNTLLTVFGDLPAERRLQPLHILRGDRVSGLSPSSGIRWTAGWIPSRRSRSASADSPSRNRP